MPSKNTSYGSTALTGLALSASIAQEATNGIPIVNQILGAVSRILKLAEKIEKDREALHALADKSQKLSLRITAVLEDRAADGQILQSLEGVRDVLHAIQSLFANLVAKTRIRRTVSYLFSVPRDVERLSAELEGALQEFLLIAALDTNVRVRENSRTIGQLRRLHDFEVEKLELVADVTSEDGSCLVKYHAAHVEGAGRLFVVRYLQGAVEGPAADAEELERSIDEHDGILEKISSVEKSHPNVAYLYGKSAGYRYNRFVVLRTGVIPLADVARSGGVTLGEVWSMVPKLLDAALHLAQVGAVWLPNIAMLDMNVFLDDRDEPTIGLINDLKQSDSVVQHEVHEFQLIMIATLLGWTDLTLCDETASSHLSALFARPEWPYPQVMDAISGTGRELEFVSSIRHRSQLANLAPLNHTANAYLMQLMSTFHDANAFATMWSWSQPLFQIVTRGVDRICSGIYVEYRAGSTADSWDQVIVSRVADDGERIDHVFYHFAIPPERTWEVRQTLGIVVPNLQPGRRSFEMVHLDDPAERSPVDGQWMLKEDD